MTAALTSKGSRLAATPFPCGSCRPCRIAKSKIMTSRILIEQMAHAESLFLTLTYERMPLCTSLCPRHLTLFFKKLRKSIEPIKIRYFAVGEYGELSFRPHYHCILFGIGADFKHQITKAWDKGFIHLMELNKTTARYITGYCTSKYTNEKNCAGRHKEFTRSSNRNGGIGNMGIELIAKKIKKNQHYDGRIIRELQFGKAKMPIGGYLTKKLSENLGIDQKTKDNDLFSYQMEVFTEFSPDDPNYYRNIVDSKAQQRKVIDKKFKIFKQKRRL